jgi:hypothetical protein
VQVVVLRRAIGGDANEFHRIQVQRDVADRIRAEQAPHDGDDSIANR